MSKFPDLHAEFIGELALMKGGILFVQAAYRGVGLLREEKSKAATPWPEEAASIIDNFVSVDRKAENLTYDGTIVLLAATYEAFVRDVIETICEEIENRVPCFDDLNETIKSWNAIATGRILSKHRQKRYSQFDYLNLSKELGTCVPGNQRYHLSSGALALHDRNLNSDELKELFRRVGIENLWEGISASAAIQNHFQITGRAAVQKISQAKLDEFISLRNQVAHNRGGESAVGPEALGQWIDFFLALAECLSAIAVDYCNKLSV